MSGRFVARWPFDAVRTPGGGSNGGVGGGGGGGSGGGAPRPGFSLLENLSAGAVFTPDARFTALNLPAYVEPHDLPIDIEADEEPYEVADPVAEAFAQGHEAGFAEARAQADLRAAEDVEARAALELSFARLDAELEEDLRRRLRDTVAALCEAAIAPMALDQDMLVRRVGAAVAMLSRAEDERVIRLHPEDIAFVSDRLKADWHVQPDPQLERGTIRVETQTGGVEDGPASWRRAIAEALQQC